MDCFFNYFSFLLVLIEAIRDVHNVRTAQARKTRYNKKKRGKVDGTVIESTTTESDDEDDEVSVSNGRRKNRVLSTPTAVSVSTVSSTNECFFKKLKSAGFANPASASYSPSFYSL
jgi:hypothetical protein